MTAIAAKIELLLHNWLNTFVQLTRGLYNNLVQSFRGLVHGLTGDRKEKPLKKDMFKRTKDWFNSLSKTKPSTTLPTALQILVSSSSMNYL